MKTSLYIILMVAVIVAADFLFFRHHFRGRLVANVAIVIAFLLFYLLFLKHK